MEPFRSEAGEGTVSCTLTMAVMTPAVLVAQVSAARRPSIRLRDRMDVTNNGRSVPTRTIVDPDGGCQHLIRAQPGNLAVTYQATVTRVGPTAPERVTDAQRLIALRPSRYCPSDRMAGFAQSRFGDLPTAADRVHAIHAYVWRHVGYDATMTWPSGDAVETLLTARGVCRDFAHLMAALCRAVDVPARVAAAYAPGLSPMDFHAVVETDIDGVWWSWDATRLAPRSTLVRIVTGRDAADVAFATVVSGRVEFSTVEVNAVAAHDLPFDDHEGYVALG